MLGEQLGGENCRIEGINPTTQRCAKTLVGATTKSGEEA